VIGKGNWVVIHDDSIIWIHRHDFLPHNKDEVHWFFFSLYVVFCTMWVETWWESQILLINKFAPDILALLFSMKLHHNWMPLYALRMCSVEDPALSTQT
jgi:hypothetical protein